jgi:16S rRNA (guanine966-N2)-methyltransferase
MANGDGAVSQRVITGKAKGRRLQMVPGESTRPITDRAKEALFSILGDWIVSTRVLDLFGGTGAVGIECLSRGADFVHFIDLERRAVETIQANLRHCRFDAQAMVERGDSFAFLQRYRGEPFDLIYVAPPQYKDMWRKALLLIDSRPDLLADFATVIVQMHPREDAPVQLAHLAEYDRRRYGSVMLVFYADAEDLQEDASDEEDGEDNDEVMGW